MTIKERLEIRKKLLLNSYNNMPEISQKAIEIPLKEWLMEIDAAIKDLEILDIFKANIDGVDNEKAPIFITILRTNADGTINKDWQRIKAYMEVNIWYY